MKTVVPILLICILSACHVSFDKTVTGNGDRKTEQKDIAGFTRVDVAGPFQVTVQQGDRFEVAIEADANLLSYIEVSKQGGTLEIREKDNYNLKSTAGIKVTIQMQDVSGLSLTGSGLLTAPATLKGQNKIAVDIAGSGKIQAELDAPEVKVEIGGSGTATLSGQTRKMDVIIGGSGDCLAEALKSEDCNINIGGSGVAKVYASQTLDVSIGGSGNVYYAGQPKVSQSIGGSGSIKPL